MKVKCELDVFSFHYPYHKELKKEVIDYLEKYPFKDKEPNNVKATMTDWNITTPQIEKLKSFTISNLVFFDYVKKIGGNYFFQDFWAIIYHKNDLTLPHDHNPSNFSFVYFLDTKKYQSPLLFSYNKEKIVPEEGKFVIFPSVLVHEVPKNKYDEKRITLAGNILRR